MEKAKSRDRFVDEIVNTIIDSDNSEGAFIFGISGKWGEGKTFFLRNLKEQLISNKKLTVSVVELNPWKYAKDDDSILRELLRQILELQPTGFKKLYLTQRLKNLYQDTTKKKLNLVNTLYASIFLLILGIFYKYPPHFLLTLKNEVSHNKPIFTLLFLPILLGIANAVTTSESSTKAISTLDSFDKMFEKLMKNLSLDRIIVYVDDLDRLTAIKALSVLDSLRTFFDKNKLVFVVASDHIVLERHLGNELLPDGTYPEKIEEGRRFLKKIFNVYWRLPLPTKPEYKTYVDDITSELNEPIIFKMFKTKDLALLRSYLLKYFSNNYRNAERFLKRVEFTLRLIDSQHKARTTPKLNKEYFTEMLENPLLVVRILLIEELANPLFDKIQDNPEILLTLEHQATSGDIEGIIIEATKKKDGVSYLSNEQIEFLKSFIPQKPRFRDESGILVKSIEPYIFLSSDSSFGDIRGLDPDEFLKFLEGDSVTELVSILNRSSESKLNEAMSSFNTAFAAITELPRKEKLLQNIIDCSVQCEPTLPARNIINSCLTNLSYTFIEQLEPAKKIDVINLLGNLELDDTQFSYVNLNTPNFNDADFSQMDRISTMSKLIQHKFLTYFNQYFASNPGDAISRLGANLTKFSQTTFNEVSSSLVNQLIAYFISDNNDSRRTTGLEIIKKLDSGEQTLKESLVQQLILKNQVIFNWVSSQAKSSTQPLFTLQEIVEVLIPNPPSNNLTAIEITERLNLFQPVPEAKDMLWKQLLKINNATLVSGLYESVLNNNFLPLAPITEVANQIVEEIIKSMVTKERAGIQGTTDWLIRISKDKWVFANLVLNNQNQQLVKSKLKVLYIGQNVREQLERIQRDF